MSNVAITKVSSRGQIVVPKEIREAMEIEEGDLFAIHAEGDTLVLKRLAVPTDEEFEEARRWAREWAKKNKWTRADVIKAVREYRDEKQRKAGSK